MTAVPIWTVRKHMATLSPNWQLELLRRLTTSLREISYESLPGHGKRTRTGISIVVTQHWKEVARNFNPTVADA